MSSKLTALLAGLFLLGLAGAAQADAFTSAETQALTLPAMMDTWSLPSMDTQPGAAPADSQVVTLTDTQLDNVTAGAWNRWYGWFGFYWYNQWVQLNGADYLIWLWY
jgi:hypothetical protein